MNRIFWNRTRRLIKKAGMTQSQFAAYIEVPPGTFAGGIYHNRLPDAETACDIGTALGVSVEYLVYGKDRNNTKTRLRELAARKAAARIEILCDKIRKEARGIQITNNK